ncbi:hypothetical protein ACIO1C_27505 [Streptomyces sp. NPDC087420]|uniref:hypothetical protein n=1 Tax=Streptomyces sp. NPDC087420 TaxID=3365785 RepID=UPI003832A12A
MIATWEAEAGYYFGVSWYRDKNYGTDADRARMDGGTLWLNKSGNTRFLKDRNFSGSFDSSGNYRFETVIEVEPGNYTVSNSSSKTVKIGGYWHEHSHDPKADNDRHTRITATKGYATVTVS